MAYISQQVLTTTCIALLAVSQLHSMRQAHELRRLSDQPIEVIDLTTEKTTRIARQLCGYDYLQQTASQHSKETALLMATADGAHLAVKSLVEDSKAQISGEIVVAAEQHPDVRAYLKSCCMVLRSGTIVCKRKRSEESAAEGRTGTRIKKEIIAGNASDQR